MKGHTWLGGKTWAEVTRDERTFCAELFFLVRDDLPAFIAYLNRAHDAGLDPKANWELAYEAVFYRDLRFHAGVKGELVSPKRTFDLALFSDDEILIIEAKAQQGFDGKQLDEFELDAKRVQALTGVRRVRLGALVSSRYSPRPATRKRFDGPFLTWKELVELYGDNEMLTRADELFRR